MDCLWRYNFGDKKLLRTLLMNTIVNRIQWNLRSFYDIYVKNLALDLGLLEGHREYCKFIVLGTARSGSNFLRGLLNAHSQIITFGELFRSYDSIGWELTAYDRYLQSRKLRTLIQENPSSFLEKKVFGKFPKHILAVGFKIFYYHAQDDSRKIVWKYLKNQKDIKIIHLKRNNTLKEIASLKKAFQTDKWTNIDGSKEKHLTLSLDYNECLGAFTWAQKTKKQYDDYFEDHDTMDVIYEDLSVNLESEVKHIQKFLRVPFEDVKPSTYKQSNQPLSTMILNYFELKRQFRNTPWEVFFED